ncbi:hypothetical protein DYB34_007100, partial [Aphanomyces astaci]
MLPRLEMPSPARAKGGRFGKDRHRRHRTTRLDYRMEQAGLLASEGIPNPEDDSTHHHSLIPREFYVVERSILPKGPSNQYASTFNGNMWETVVFPSLEPHTRAEVLHLKDALAKMEASLKQRASSHSDDDDKELTDPSVTYSAAYCSMEWEIYSLCFSELIRQLTFVCRDQSTLLRTIQGRLHDVFQRVLASMRAMEVTIQERHSATAASSSSSQPQQHRESVAVKSNPTANLLPAEDNAIDLDDDGDTSDTEEFICSFCYEMCRDPKKETTRGSTFLGNMHLKRLSVDIGSDAKKLKAVAKIQAIYRGHRCRKQQMHATRILQRNTAATRIQRMFRGYMDCKKASNRRRVLAVWKKRAHQLSAITNLQRSARRFLKRNQTFRETKLADVVGQFKLVDSEVAERVQEKAAEVARLMANVQTYHRQVRGIEYLLHADEMEGKQAASNDTGGEGKDGAKDSNNTSAAAAEDNGATKHMHLESLCASVSMGLRLIHERTANLRAREAKLQEELEEARRQMEDLEAQQAAQAAKQPSDDDDDADDWHLPGDVDSNQPDNDQGSIRTARDLIDSIKSIRATRHRRGGDVTSASIYEAAILHGARSGTMPSTRSPSTVLSLPPSTADSNTHATAALLSRIRVDVAVQPRIPRPLLWLKQLMGDIYDTLGSTEDEVQPTFLHYCTWLTPAEFLHVRDTMSCPTANVCDTVYQHFQCQFGLSSLVDQAISDLATSVQSHASTDDDVLLFQCFLNGARPKQDLRFFCHLRTMCPPSIDSSRFHRHVLDLPHALKVAHTLFRVDESAHAAAAYASFALQLQLRVLRPPSFPRRHNVPTSSTALTPTKSGPTIIPTVPPPPPTVPTLVLFTDFFDLLCVHHADARLTCLRHLWVMDRFQEMDRDGDGAISLDEFVWHLAPLPHAPTSRELKQLFQHATSTTDKLTRMTFGTFEGTMLRLLRNKQLQASPDDVGRHPALRRQVAESRKLLHTIARHWHMKKDVVDATVDAMFHRTGTQRNLAAYLLVLRGELEGVLMGSVVGVESCLEAWHKYAAIVCVLLALKAKNDGFERVTEAHVVDLERAWHLQDDVEAKVYRGTTTTTETIPGSPKGQGRKGSVMSSVASLSEVIPPPSLGGTEKESMVQEATLSSLPRTVLGCTGRTSSSRSLRDHLRRSSEGSESSIESPGGHDEDVSRQRLLEKARNALLFSVFLVVLGVGVLVTAWALCTATDQFMAAGAAVSCLFSFAILVSYMECARLRKYPNQLIVHKRFPRHPSCRLPSSLILTSAIDLVLSVVNIVQFACASSPIVPSQTTSFALGLLFAGEFWFCAMSIDLIQSITNPFSSFSYNLHLYRVSSVLLGVVGSLTLSTSSTALLASLPVVHHQMQLPWMIYYSSVACSMLVSIGCFLYVQRYSICSQRACESHSACLHLLARRLATGLEETFDTRKQVLVHGLLASVTYISWSVVVLAVVAAAVLVPGLVNLFVWGLTNGRDLSAVLCFTPHISDELDNPDELLKPQLNLALRRQLIQMATKGIVDAVEHYLLLHQSIRTNQSFALDWDPKQRSTSVSGVDFGLRRRRQRMDEMHFEDFQPRIFATVRALSDIDDHEYLRSFRATANERLSEGRSGAFVFSTSNRRYMAKSMTKAEKTFLISIMPAYVQYLKWNPSTLLPRFYGVHAMKLYGKMFYVVVMANIFATTEAIHRRYDIKGSWVDRNAPVCVIRDLVRCANCNKQFTFGVNDHDIPCHSTVGEHYPDITLRDNDLKKRIKLPRGKLS